MLSHQNSLRTIRTLAYGDHMTLTSSPNLKLTKFENQITKFRIVRPKQSLFSTITVPTSSLPTSLSCHSPPLPHNAPMNLPKPLLNPSSFFAPALSYISSQRPHTRDPSIDDSSKMGLTRHLSRDSSSSADLDSNGIPLIDFSRTPSPNPYRARQSGSGSGAVSEDEDFDADIPLSLRPLVDEHPERKRLWKSGGLGAFLFGTWAGWQVYVGVLVLYVSCVSYVLVLLNRFILWSKALPSI